MCFNNGLDNADSITDTCELAKLVYECGGNKCWLCGDTSFAVGIVHHIHPKAWRSPFPAYLANGLIPKHFDLSHPDNLIPLCRSCQTSYDADFPEWILVPDTDTLKKYIEHEKKDYDLRFLISQSSTNSVPPRTLPLIDRTQVTYYPLFLSPHLHLPRFEFDHWPKNWLGEPTAVIHRATWRGLLNPSPIQPIRLPVGPRMWQRGVPAIFQILVVELVRLWTRPVPVTRGQVRRF